MISTHTSNFNDYFYPLVNNASLESTLNISNKFQYLKNLAIHHFQATGISEEDFVNNQAILFLNSLIGARLDALKVINPSTSFQSIMGEVEEVIPLRSSKAIRAQLSLLGHTDLIQELPSAILIQSGKIITPVEVVISPGQAKRIVLLRTYKEAVLSRLAENALLKRHFENKINSSLGEYTLRNGSFLFPDTKRNESYLHYHGSLIPNSFGIYPAGVWRYNYNNFKDLRFKEDKNTFLFPYSRVREVYSPHVLSQQDYFNLPNPDLLKIFINTLPVSKRVLERGSGQIDSQAEGTEIVRCERPYHIDEIFQITAAVLTSLCPSTLYASHLPDTLKTNHVNTVEDLLNILFEKTYTSGGAELFEPA